MPTETPQIDPLPPRPDDAAPSTDAAKVKIRVGRYGEVDAHELIYLIDSIEDERARARFRESIYLSLFFWLAIAWLIFYGPRVLWHAPRIKMASEVLKEREMLTLNAPRLPRSPSPVPKSAAPAPKALEHMREMERRETPRPPTPQPQPTSATPPPQPVAIPRATSAPNISIPSAPQPQPRPSQPVPDAPSVQPSTRPNFATPSNASEAMRDVTRGATRGGGGGGGIISAPARGGSSAGAGSEILSDTQGVDFTSWKRRFDRGTIDAWLPLLPEEIQPPLSKKGTTTILLTVLPDGSIGDMKLEGSTHDDAINKAAWGSLISQGKLPPLPTAFHGPNLVLRLHYLVNMDR